MANTNTSTDFSQSTDLTELIDFLNDHWERREPDPVEELAEDLGAFLQEGGELARSVSSLLSGARSVSSLTTPQFSIC